MSVLVRLKRGVVVGLVGFVLTFLCRLMVLVMAYDRFPKENYLWLGLGGGSGFIVGVFLRSDRVPAAVIRGILGFMVGAVIGSILGAAWAEIVARPVWNEIVQNGMHMKIKGTFPESLIPMGFTRGFGTGGLAGAIVAATWPCRRAVRATGILIAGSLVLAVVIYFEQWFASTSDNYLKFWLDPTRVRQLR